MRPPRGRSAVRFRGGRDGGRGFREISSFVQTCEGDAVKKLTNEKISYYNTPIYLQNKTQLEKVDEIFGLINESLQGATDDRLVLLKAVSGAFRAGVLTSLMGMFVEEFMKLVELTPLRSALVVLPGINGLSTEQHKRLTIVVELVANPSIIFMDEPISGINVSEAVIVMRIIRNTVDMGRTIVCTIHQPNIDIFETFDEVNLIA
ncbi:hypothetical protein HAX54_030848 [Datura stramonium]|uniref:H/ACA ribonucleoprotein complex subunit n=1 Tax=Datura stramonium TaxID=4076 RepID=A0ABS8V9I5_DATST|nr:hypothetical protein [Datura stramonium]